MTPALGIKDDLPLVLFSSFAIMGAGIPAVQPLVWLSVGNIRGPGEIHSAAVAVLVVIAVLCSTRHLGRRKRILLAFSRIERSRLSVEVLLAALLAATALVTSIAGQPFSHFVWFLTVVTALLFLLAAGFVYRLGGQLTWCGETTAAPFAVGLLWGSLFYASFGAASGSTALPVVYWLLVLDSTVTVLRWRRIGKYSGEGEPRHMVAFGRRRAILASRIVAADLLAAFLLVVLGPMAALLPLTAGVFIDRYSFYALGLQHTTEAEIGRVESLMRIERS